MSSTSSELSPGTDLMLGDMPGERERCDPGDLGGRSPGCDRFLVGRTSRDCCFFTARWKPAELERGMLGDIGVASVSFMRGSSGSGDDVLGMSK